MWTDNASEIDMLFYKPYAEIISNVAADTDKNPLNIGVFGSWGAGKSTLLNLISKNYENKDDIICVSINAWMFENYEDAKSAIMEVLLRELEEKSHSENIKKKLKNLIKKVDFLKVGAKFVSTAVPVVASVATGNPLPFILNIPNNASDISKAIKTVSDSVKNFKQDYLKEEDIEDDSVVNNVRQFRKEFESSLEDDSINRVVVLIDDLDRCQPESIIETLEAIKLFLSVNKTTFIIAADENVIQYAIKQKYPKIEGFDYELDKEYIEKLIQLPIQIPELSSKDIQNYLLLLVMQKYMNSENFKKMISEIEKRDLMVEATAITCEQLMQIDSCIADSIEILKREEYNEVLNIVLQIRHIAAYTLKGNPRQAKRFLNTFITKRQLSKLYFGDELDMKIMAKLLILHRISPELFAQLNNWNKEFQVDNSQFRLMREQMESQKLDSQYQKWDNPIIKEWIKCEPVELDKKRLDKYFYLTREILNKDDGMESNLSEASKKILECVENISAARVPGLIEEINKLSSGDKIDVLKILIDKISEGRIKSCLWSGLFVNFEEYRDKVLESLKNRHDKMSAGEIGALMTMYSCDPQKMDAFLTVLKNKKLIEDEMITKIKKK